MCQGVPRLLTFLVLALACASCGGGGGGEGGQPHLFSGEYVYVQTTAATVGDPLRCEVGMASADGVGTLTFLEGYASDEGSMTGPFVPPARSFQVSAARDLTVVDPASLSVVGRLAADGSIAALTSRGNMVSPAFMLIARRAPVPTQASLSGTWHYVRWGRSAAADKMAMSAAGTAVVDAAGGVTFPDLESNTDGIIPTILTPTLPNKITPAAGGWLQWTNMAATQVWFRGGMSADANLLVFGSREDSGSRAVVRVLVRSGQASSTADLVGGYGMAGFAGYYTRSAWGPFFGSVALNGGGTGTMTFTSIAAGEIADPDVASVAYGVGSAGGLDLTLYGIALFAGGVGSGGRYAILGGSFKDTSPPMHIVLVR